MSSAAGITSVAGGSGREAAWKAKRWRSTSGVLPRPKTCEFVVRGSLEDHCGFIRSLNLAAPQMHIEPKCSTGSRTRRPAVGRPLGPRPIVQMRRRRHHHPRSLAGDVPQGAGNRPVRPT